MSPETFKLITDELRRVLKLFVSKNYSALELKTGGVRLTAEDMKSAVTRYGKTLVFPPEDGFERLDLIEVDNSKPKRYSLRFDFWTKEQGRSDLSLEATIIEEGTQLRWEIDDIHVL